jgi:hypothetical protein
MDESKHMTDFRIYLESLNAPDQFILDVFKTCA